MKLLNSTLLIVVLGFGISQAIASQTDLSPKTPLARLKQGNMQYVQGMPRPTNVDEKTRRQLTTEGQKPFAIIVSCADSRVPPELIFNQGLGDLFVLRIAGNIASKENLASIEYAVANLNASLIVVLGHTKCGAVAAACSGKHLPGNLPQLMIYITPAVKQVRSRRSQLTEEAFIEEVAQENVRQTLKSIYSHSKVVQQFAQSGKVKFAGGVYDLRKGTIQWLEVPKNLPKAN